MRIAHPHARSPAVGFAELCLRNRILPVRDRYIGLLFRRKLCHQSTNFILGFDYRSRNGDLSDIFTHGQTANEVRSLFRVPYNKSFDIIDPLFLTCLTEWQRDSYTRISFSNTIRAQDTPSGPTACVQSSSNCTIPACGTNWSTCRSLPQPKIGS